MSKKEKFRAVIEGAGNGGAFITIPFDVETRFGKKRVKVKATFDGIPYRGSLVRMGGPCHVLGVLKEIRDTLGKSAGDEIEVSIEEDTEPRVVALPQGLKQALARQPKAAAFFEQLAYSHQRVYVRWIEGAKRETTRQSRINQTIELLKQAKRQP